MSTRSDVEHPQRLLADGGLGESRGPGRRAVAAITDWHGGQPAAIGTELVTTIRSRSVGSRAAMRAVVVPASSSTRPPVAGTKSTAARGDRVLVVGAGGLALADAGFDEVQRAGRHCAAVDPSQHAGLVEDGQVAAHGFGGDVVGLGELGDRGATLADHQ